MPQTVKKRDTSEILFGDSNSDGVIVPISLLIRCRFGFRDLPEPTSTPPLRPVSRGAYRINRESTLSWKSPASSRESEPTRS